MVSVGPSSKSRPPLHDFPLPDWNWSTNRPVANAPHRHWKVADSRTKPKSPLPLKLRENDDNNHSDDKFLPRRAHNDADSEKKKRRSPPAASHGSKTGRAVAEEPESDGRSKTLMIRLCVKNKADPAVEDGEVRDQESEAKSKTLNLRPRKAGHHQSGSSPAAPIPSSSGRSESLKRLRNHSEAKAGVEDVKKPPNKFEIALSKQKILEDIFAMTGSKPSRRPKKRSKAVQKQLDSVFPGLWLPYINPDSYRVAEKPPKKV